MPKVTILCTDPEHPVNAWLHRWMEGLAGKAQIEIMREPEELRGGDFLFLVSCQRIVQKSARELYRYALVLHASALPKGRGMSPHVWQILDGQKSLTMTLLNAAELVDTGEIWCRKEVNLDGSELFDEINQKIFEAELSLMNWAITNCDRSKPIPQIGEPTYYRKRTPEDSRIEPNMTIASQFDLIRVADPIRYPAFFEHLGHKYKLTLERIRDDSDV